MTPGPGSPRTPWATRANLIMKGHPRVSFLFCIVGDGIYDVPLRTHQNLSRRGDYQSPALQSPTALRSPLYTRGPLDIRAPSLPLTRLRPQARFGAQPPKAALSAEMRCPAGAEGEIKNKGHPLGCPSYFYFFAFSLALLSFIICISFAVISLAPFSFAQATQPLRTVGRKIRGTFSSMFSASSVK